MANVSDKERGPAGNTEKTRHRWEIENLGHCCSISIIGHKLFIILFNGESALNPVLPLLLPGEPERK